MPDTIETTSTGPGTTITKWFKAQVDIRTVVAIIGAIIYVAFFWKDSHENWDKVKEQDKVIATKADAEELKALKEQVNRQYMTQREVDSKQDLQVKENSFWIEQQKGYKQGLEESKHK